MAISNVRPTPPYVVTNRGVTSKELEAVEDQIDAKANRSGDTFTGNVTVAKDVPMLRLQHTVAADRFDLRVQSGNFRVEHGNTVALSLDPEDAAGELWGNKIWHAGNFDPAVKADQALITRIGAYPGRAPHFFTTGLIGISDDLQPLNESLIENDSEGYVVRLGGNTQVAMREAQRVETGRTYAVRFVVRRRQNTPDPANDSVQLKIAWLDREQQVAVATSTLATFNALTTGSGRTVAEFFVSQTAGTGIVQAPAGTVYARPYVQVFGTAPKTDIELIDFYDITDADFVDQDVTLLDTRIDALESIDSGDRLDALESVTTTPELTRYRTKADAVAATVPASVDYVETLALGLQRTHGLYERGSGGLSGFTSNAGAVSWKPFGKGPLNASIFGVMADHDGTEIGGTDDSEALEDMFTWLTTNARVVDLHGGVRFARTTPIVMEANAKFKLRGLGWPFTYVYVQDDVECFLRVKDRVGLWNGDEEYEGDGERPPPPHNLTTLTIEDLGFFGRGNRADGTPVKTQGCLTFQQRHDNIFLRRLGFFGFYGSPIWMGYPSDNQGNGGVREGTAEEVILQRCGTLTEAAVKIWGVGETFGHNYYKWRNCECSLARSVGIHIGAWCDANGTHMVEFDTLKQHGTGEFSSNFGVGQSTTAMIIEGGGTNIVIRNHWCNQWAADPAQPDLYTIVVKAADIDLEVVTETTAHVDLAGGGLANGTTHNGVVVATGQKVFVKAQIPKTTNGVYDVPASGAASRSAEFSVAADFPMAKIKNVNNNKHYIHGRMSPITLGTSQVEFQEFDRGWPRSITWQGTLLSCNNGIYVQGGDKNYWKFDHYGGVTYNLMKFGPQIRGLQIVEFKKSNAPAVIACEGQSSALVRLECDSRLETVLRIWDKYETCSLGPLDPYLIPQVAAIRNNTTTVLALPNTGGRMILLANRSYKFYMRYEWLTNASAGFKYSFVASAALSSYALAIRTKAPGAASFTDTTITSPTALPSAVTIAGGGTDIGVIEISGSITVGAAESTITMRVAQATAHASDTTVLVGGHYEFRQLVT